MKKALVVIVFTAFFSLYAVSVFAVAGPKLGDTTGSYPGFNANKHNLSSQSSNTYKAIATGDPTGRDTQICIFCHTPHNSTPQSTLWNRPDTPVTSFGRYSSSTLYITHNSAAIAAAKYGEPNGSSRLCLSCHDGVTALGLVKNGAQIYMQGGNDLITGIAKFDANKVKLGHHPVSFIYDTTVVADLALKTLGKTYTSPAISEVQLFSSGGSDRSRKWMQCATCHDPHQNKTDDTICWSDTGPPYSTGTCGTAGYTKLRKVAPFWVVGTGTPNGTGGATTDHDKVCTACHALMGTQLYPAPYP